MSVHDTNTDDADATPTVTLPTDSFRKFLAPVAELVDECVIRLSESEGLTVAAVDAANVAMVEAELSPDAFDTFDVPEETAFGANVTLFARLFDDDRELGETLSFAVDETRKKVDLEMGSFEYTYAYIDPEYIRPEPEIPALDLTADVELAGGLLRDGVEFTGILDDHIRAVFDADTQTLRLSAEGSTDDGAWTARNEDLWVRVGGPADSRFSTDYFRDLVANLPEERDVRVRLGEEFPMKVSYGIVADEETPGNVYHGEVTLMQAPRLSS